MDSNKEKALGNVRPGNESYIEFNDSIPKLIIVFLYLHGFTASGIEGDPHRKLPNFLTQIFMFLDFMVMD